MSIKRHFSYSLCNACQIAKSHKLPLSMAHHSSVIPFETIHVDIWGSSPIISSNDIHYFLLFVDDCTRYKWLFVMHGKGQASQLFHHFDAMISKQFNCDIKKLHNDGGVEFKSFKPFLLHPSLRRLS